MLATETTPYYEGIAINNSNFLIFQNIVALKEKHVYLLKLAKIIKSSATMGL